MAETTMAPAHLAPAKRRVPVGWRFHPTDQELVGHFLRHKLKAEDLPIDETIPEIGVCKGEPWDLLEWATSASGGKFDESQCFFFSPRDYKYSNSNRSNRTTSCGFWKVTGRDRKITCKNTNKVIGTKKTLVYYKRRVPRAIKTPWIIHEYHDSELTHDQRTYVLCWLREDNKKKKEKTHQVEKKSEEKTQQLERRTFNLLLWRPILLSSYSLEWATSASGGKFDESQCFFFSPRDYKYSNSNRSNRTTSCGFWKVTGRDRKITCKNTNKVIGTKKTLVYYKRRVPRAIKTPWIIHEYHDSELTHDQRTYVLCWLREDNKKKKEKTHQVEKKSEEKTQQLERRTFNRRMFKHGNQTNLEEHSSSNTMIQVSSESNEDSMNQISSQSNGIINPIQQIYPQSYEALSSMIEPRSQLDEELASILHSPVHHYLNQVLPQQ